MQLNDSFLWEFHHGLPLRRPCRRSPGDVSGRSAHDPGQHGGLACDQCALWLRRPGSADRAAADWWGSAGSQGAATRPSLRAGGQGDGAAASGRVGGLSADGVVILEANQPGLWACPCHSLAPTKAGMVTVRRYEPPALNP